MSYFGVIYKITNTLTNKMYIGQTRKNPPVLRFRQHFFKRKDFSGPLYNSYLKYGKNISIFKHEIIFHCFNQNDLNYMETFFIKSLYTISPNGYNLTYGGESPIMSEETRRKMSLRQKGLKRSDLVKARMSKCRKGFTSENRRKVQRSVADKLKQKLVATNIHTNLEICFSSIAQCSEVLNLNPENISRVMSGKQGRTQHKGWRFLAICGTKNRQVLPLLSPSYISINKHGSFVVTTRGEYLGSYPSKEIAQNVLDMYLSKNYNELLNYLLFLREKQIITVWSKKFDKLTELLKINQKNS